MLLKKLTLFQPSDWKFEQSWGHKLTRNTFCWKDQTGPTKLFSTKDCGLEGRASVTLLSLHQAVKIALNCQISLNNINIRTNCCKISVMACQCIEKDSSWHWHTLTLGLCTQSLPGIERSDAEVKQRCQTLRATRQVQQPKPCKAWGMDA